MYPHGYCNNHKQQNTPPAPLKGSETANWVKIILAGILAGIYRIRHKKALVV